jgi:hypothetical protein
MVRRHIPLQLMILEDRLAGEAQRLRAQAKSLRAGFDKDRLLRRARLVESAAHICAWLRPPGSR